ncbi:MAG: hypothetical protein FRX49_02587 [Trebouxia sp. A1-2]|nr:MAG: hypothetical protein FRX49_02587 [Trebouxia sp. A1-2]
MSGSKTARKSLCLTGGQSDYTAYWLSQLRVNDVEVEVVEAVANEASLGAGVATYGCDELSESKGLSGLRTSDPGFPVKDGNPALMSSSRESSAFFGGLPACCNIPACNS